MRLHLFAVLTLLVSACASSGPATDVATPTTAEPSQGAESSEDGASGDVAPIGEGEWPTFRLNAERTGSADSTGSDTVPDLLWTFDTGGVVESSPAVVDGVVYAGTFNNTLFALDAATGQERWAFAVGGLVRASPSVVDGRVFFGADDNLFYAVDA